MSRTNRKNMNNIIIFAIGAFLFYSAYARELSIADFGAVPKVKTMGASNAAAISAAIGNATKGDTVYVPGGNEWYALGGIFGKNLHGVTLRFDGILRAIDDFKNWPFSSPKKSHYAHFILIQNSTDVTVTGNGTIDGQGLKWWNRYIIDPLPAKRPKLVVFENVTDILVENVHMLNSPSFHLMLDDVARVEVRFISIIVDRKHQRKLKKILRQRRLATTPYRDDFPPLEPEDLNTDGIDPRGKDIWIHDCIIKNDDDSIAVKPCSKTCVNSDCSENMLIENMVLAGFGASVGSVSPHTETNCVRNITFRNLTMPHTGKGIYVKSNPTCEPGATALIQDILYENVTMLEPRWWAIWIGPQQQHEPGSPLGRKCALDYPINDHCPTQGCVSFRNITLRNIEVIKPLLSPGVLLGNVSDPMQITFDNVQVTNPGSYPFNGTYQCENADVTVINSFPIPDC